MTIHWLCSCGKKFDNGVEGFLHRDEDLKPSHHVKPIVAGQPTHSEFHGLICEDGRIVDHLSRGARV